VKGAVQRARGGVLRMQIESPAVEDLKEEIRRAGRRRDTVTVGAAILLGGLVWLAVSGTAEWPGWALFLLGAAWLTVAWRRR
jgi:hypothetical protein